MLFMIRDFRWRSLGVSPFLCLVSWDGEKGISCGTTCVELIFYVQQHFVHGLEQVLRRSFCLYLSDS